MSSDPPTWKRLIDPTLPTDKRIQLIITIYSDSDEAGALKYLAGNDAQGFIDVIDEASICILLPLENGSIESH